MRLKTVSMLSTLGILAIAGFVFCKWQENKKPENQIVKILGAPLPKASGTPHIALWRAPHLNWVSLYLKVPMRYEDAIGFIKAIEMKPANSQEGWTCVGRSSDGKPEWWDPPKPEQTTNLFINQSGGLSLCTWFNGQLYLEKSGGYAKRSRR